MSEHIPLALKSPFGFKWREPVTFYPWSWYSLEWQRCHHQFYFRHRWQQFNPCMCSSLGRWLKTFGDCSLWIHFIFFMCHWRNELHPVSKMYWCYDLYHQIAHTPVGHKTISEIWLSYVHDCLWGFETRSPEAFDGETRATSNWSSWDIIHKIWPDETFTIDMEIRWIDWTRPLWKCHRMAKEHNHGKIFLHQNGVYHSDLFTILLNEGCPLSWSYNCQCAIPAQTDLVTSVNLSRI